MLLKWLIKQGDAKSNNSDGNASQSDRQIDAKSQTVIVDKLDMDNERVDIAQEDEEGNDGEVDKMEEAQPAHSFSASNELKLVAPSKHNLQPLVLLNAACLPLDYGGKNSPHYRMVVSNGLDEWMRTVAMEECEDEDDESEEDDDFVTSYWTKMAYYKSNALVGAISVMAEPIPASEQTKKGTKKKTFNVLIFTLSVLPSFRRRGVASLLLRDLFDQCQRWGNVEKLSLHCQTCNESARAFYARHNFVEVMHCPNYYARLPEPDALLLERKL